MLDPIRLRHCLKTQFCGRYLIQWSQIDSTNRVLMDWLRAGSHSWPEGLTLAGSRQTAGRGQQSRLWDSPTGGLYLSVLLKPHLPSVDLSRGRLEPLTVALGWGIAAQLKQFCRRWGSDQADAIGVKWPNDLVIHGHKLAGILTQAQWQGSHLRGVAVGVGLNVNRIPAEGTCLATLLGMRLDLTLVAAQVLQGIEQGYLMWHSQGLDPLVTDYNRWLWHRDQSIELPAARQTNSQGTVLGVAASAHLRIQTQTGVQTFSPGSLNLGYANSDPP